MCFHRLTLVLLTVADCGQPGWGLRLLVRPNPGEILRFAALRSEGYAQGSFSKPVKARKARRTQRVSFGLLLRPVLRQSSARNSLFVVHFSSFESRASKE